MKISWSKLSAARIDLLLLSSYNPTKALRRPNTWIRRVLEKRRDGRRVLPACRTRRLGAFVALIAMNYQQPASCPIAGSLLK